MKITQLGYHRLEAETVRRHLQAGEFRSLVTAEGNFTLAATQNDQTWLVASQYSLFGYHFVHHGGQFVHDRSLLEVVRRSGIGWKWNISALADLCELQHLLEDDTLHADVQRVPRAAVVHFDGRQVHVHRFADDQLQKQGDGSDADALEAFNEEINFWDDSPAPLLSMSGGFDARVMLSSLLRSGRRPQLLVMGSDESTDVAITRAIAQRFSLPLTQIPIEADNYLPHGSEIMQQCDGAQPAAHWHAYIYLAKSGLAGRKVLIGTNGELARTFFLDKGGLAVAADLAGRRLLPEFWRRRLSRQPVFRESEGAQLDSALSDALWQSHRAQRLDRVVALCRGRRFLDSLDAFYLQQRVRRFISNGVRLAAAQFEPVLPFMSRRWIAAVNALPRREKMGCAWHRMAIQQNCAELLEFPEPGRSPRMSPRPPPLYWVKRKGRPAVISYNAFDSFSRSDDAKEYLCSRRELLDEIIEPRLVETIAEEHQSSGQRRAAVSLLLSLIVWAEQVRAVESPRGDGEP